MSIMCLCYSCKWNSIHNEDAAKGYCELEFDIVIDSSGECDQREQV